MTIGRMTVVVAVSLLCAQVRGGTEQLSMSSTIQYPRVIQGAIEPVNAYVYNVAPAGSDLGNYRVTADYAAAGAGGYTNVGYSYTGTKIADGGTSYVSMSFPIDTSTFTPGTAAVTVTGTDTDTGGVLTQGGTFMVLAHANPALVINGQIVYLTTANVVKFQTPCNSDAFGQGPSAGTEAPASASPQLLGDPPGVPTSELDLDGITTSGSAYLTTTLHPLFDLPANDNPAEAVPFEIDAFVPGPGDYTTTFTLHYSDEDDLPGAAAPGSEELSFTVEAEVSMTTIDWTVTTVPEPASGWLIAAGAICLCYRAGKQLILRKMCAG